MHQRNSLNQLQRFSIQSQSKNRRIDNPVKPGQTSVNLYSTKPNIRVTIWPTLPTIMAEQQSKKHGCLESSKYPTTKFHIRSGNERPSTVLCYDLPATGPHELNRSKYTLISRTANKHGHKPLIYMKTARAESTVLKYPQPPLMNHSFDRSTPWTRNLLWQTSVKIDRNIL